MRVVGAKVVALVSLLGIIAFALPGTTNGAATTATDSANVVTGPGAFIYDIAPDVPKAQVKLIQTALQIAEGYLERVYGGGIPPEARSKITVKIVATGKGNQELGGGGACCTGLAESGPRPFFDVKHPQWAQNTSGRGWTTETDIMKTVVHEFTHTWQSYLGAMTIHSQPLGNWMDEGIAEYVAYSAMVEAHRMSQANADKMELNSSLDGELKSPLATFGGVQTPIWVGHVGYLAIQWLVAGSPNGPLSLRMLAQDIGKGQSVETAFRDAFGLQLSDFYKQFETWRAVALKDPKHALSRRQPLVHPSTTTAEAASATPTPPRSASELFALGYAFDVGTGQQKDDAQAAKYYQMAADAGSVPAMRNLAGMYGSGRGVPADPARAKQLFLAAALGGDAQAAYALANWYTDDPSEKIVWLQRAAAGNHPDAIALLKQLGAPLSQTTTAAPLSLQWSKVCDPKISNRCAIRRDVADASGGISASLIIYLNSPAHPIIIEARVPTLRALQQSTMWHFGSFTKKVPYAYCTKTYCTTFLYTNSATLKTLTKATTFEVATTAVSDATATTYSIDLASLPAVLKAQSVAGDASPPQLLVDTTVNEQSPWLSLCTTSLRGTKICGAGKLEARSGELSAGLSIFKQDKGAIVLITLPTEVALPNEVGIELATTQKYSNPQPYQYCLPQSCASWVTIDAPLMEKVYEAGSLTIVARDLVGKSLSWNFDLDGARRVLDANE
jgi:invasion protein IalB